MGDCRTCHWNLYKGIDVEFVDCNHPVTVQKRVKWKKGDPAFVNMMTSDVPFSRLDELKDCPTYQKQGSQAGESPATPTQEE